MITFYSTEAKNPNAGKTTYANLNTKIAQHKSWQHC